MSIGIGLVFEFGGKYTAGQSLVDFNQNRLTKEFVAQHSDLSGGVKKNLLNILIFLF
jgi:hypothetical protein